MAQTLASGVVIPAPGDRISAQGVQEMRTLGASVSTGLAQTDLQARARDAELAALIAGMEGMTYVGTWEAGRTYRINDVVTHGGDSWARLTAGSTGVPGIDAAHWGLVARKGDGGGFGKLTETPTPGLWEGVDVGIEARLAALEQDTGTRRLEGGIPGYISGEVTLRRVGKVIMFSTNELRATPNNGASTLTLPSSFIPSGFRFFPPTYLYISSFARSASHNIGSMRISRYGGIDMYNMNGLAANVVATWITDEAYSATLPGAPA